MRAPAGSVTRKLIKELQQGRATATELALVLGLDRDVTSSALSALRGKGVVVRGEPAPRVKCEHCGQYVGGRVPRYYQLAEQQAVG